MLKESINAVIDYLYNSCQIELALELIRDSLSEDIIDKESVATILNEIALEDADHAVVVEALEIMNDFEIEKSIELKHKHFTGDIKYRLEEIVRFIPNTDLSKLAQSRIDAINYDINEYLNSLTDE
ncbi:MAG: hypothetical protein AAGE96_06320 [Cyanobacteria bacterium P01_G01_bin.19]